jgi:ribosomal protein S18 acetylase RimI-like enzyme
MNDISINPFNVADLTALVSIFEAQLREHDIATSPDSLAAVLRTLSVQPQHGLILTASHDDSLIGVAYAASILSLEHGGWSGWLEEFYVLPAWRGRGVGSRLLAAVIAAAKERGWPALDLEVDSSHTRVVSLYTRNNFQSLSRTRFVRRLDD